MVILYNVKNQALLDLSARKRFWNAPWTHEKKPETYMLHHNGMRIAYNVY